MCFTTHITPGNNLKSGLLCCVNVIRYELAVFLSDWMAGRFDCESIRKMRSHVILSRDQLSKGRNLPLINNDRLNIEVWR